MGDQGVEVWWRIEGICMKQWSIEQVGESLGEKGCRSGLGEDFEAAEQLARL